MLFVLRTALGSRVFQQSEVGAHGEEEGVGGDEQREMSEDAKDQVVDLIVDIERREKRAGAVQMVQVGLGSKTWCGRSASSTSDIDHSNYPPFLQLCITDCKMKLSDIQLTFTFEPGKEGDLLERMEFWDSPSTIQWFHERGYRLYQRAVNQYGDRSSWLVPQVLPPEECNEAQYPYAHYDARVVSKYSIALREEIYSGKVAFAQDLSDRHVAIKVVKDNTDEYRILAFLKGQSLEALRENCVIPVLDLLPIEGFWFVIMPRWGSNPLVPQPQTIGQLLPIMHSMLKGLTFLHGNNISHGDLNMRNLLTNHFADRYHLKENAMRGELRSRGLLSYALFDFDFSVRWPPESDRTQCRLPYYRAWGTFNLVMDVAQGEYDYNPFIFDVGVLGAVFCEFTQHRTAKLPLLAPLLDGMTTRNLEKRFTASEALQFFEKMTSELTETELEQSLEGEETHEDTPYYLYDRWRNVPPDFRIRWAAFREPPIPWTTWILRRLCSYIWVFHTVAQIRWLCSALASTTRRAVTYFVGFRNF